MFSLCVVPVTVISINLNTSIIPGSPLALTCKYSLNPAVNTPVNETVTWMKGQLVLTTSEKFLVDGTNLIIFSLATSNTGNYSCILTLTPSPETPNVTVQTMQVSDTVSITVPST